MRLPVVLPLFLLSLILTVSTTTEVEKLLKHFETEVPVDKLKNSMQQDMDKASMAKQMGENIYAEMSAELQAAWTTVAKKCFLNRSRAILDYLNEVTTMIVELLNGKKSAASPDEETSYACKLKKPVRLWHFVKFAKRMKAIEDTLQEDPQTKREYEQFVEECPLDKIDEFVSEMIQLEQQTIAIAKSKQ